MSFSTSTQISFSSGALSRPRKISSERRGKREKKRSRGSARNYKIVSRLGRMKGPVLLPLVPRWSTIRPSHQYIDRCDTSVMDVVVVLLMELGTTGGRSTVPGALAAVLMGRAGNDVCQFRLLPAANDYFRRHVTLDQAFIVSNEG